MDSDMKFFLWIIVLIILGPLLGLGISEWQKQDCRIELARIGKTVEEIKEICR